ncbi:hypothetical protein ASPZODRAFT_133341 [Penicilliopsis zonata CBS 506.65]|uniref:Protein CFT1 n=1 Tax=Penicilliopsis zonata CBS 506.65 TaxID=1073090 RepID=A0A1L9SGL6_9EURO|nr:hypothetical protein ASPZODRAFT_133341 [Penicilliopsis zonata CBS 506.65]OJJ46311.1 hypothetical protein ASPZODRAFT_133341 [Penicilliopsis zonata CBS 506.65]
MQCYTELLPPMGVTHAISVAFTSATARNLVVARTSLLQIFSLIETPARHDDLSEDTESSTTKLVLEREYDLPGIVTDLSRVSVMNTKSGGEAILLAFRNAKLSLIEWDHERHGISTISIHYYERDELAHSPWVPDFSSCGSILSVDPSSRCALFNFGVRNLAILPFHQAGDDLIMDDYEANIEKEDVERASELNNDTDMMTKDDASYQTPYASSFVLPLTALDPSLLHPISFAFLYEYREPTFGILYSQIATSNALIYERKDVVYYAVFTLDLEQRASTTLLSIPRLPSDLFKVVALPPPVGGALLIGSNELVHVDQSGKTNAVGVNEFARQLSGFSMTDQSDLALRLEGCTVERLGSDNGDLVLALNTGNLALVRFKLDGRSVSGISVLLLPAQNGGNLLGSSASCSAFLGDGKVFLGSEDADSLLLNGSLSSGIKRPSTQLEHFSDEQANVSDEELIEDDAYEDDLYSSAPAVPHDTPHASIPRVSSGLYNFQVHDRLLNTGPLRDVVLGKSHTTTMQEEDPAPVDNPDTLELVAAQGSDRSGGLVILKREIDPVPISSVKTDSAEFAWSLEVAHGPARSDKRESRCYVIVSKSQSLDKEESEVFLADGQDLSPFKAPEFNPNADLTIEAGTIANATRVVQILKSEVRSYDSDLGLAQIYPIWDEDTSEECTAVSASFSDPYIAILRDDHNLLLLQADASGDLDEVDLADDFKSTKWQSCCLYDDNSGVFTASSENQPEGGMLLFMLSQESKLFIFRLADQKLLNVIDSVDHLQPILSSETPRRSYTRENLKEFVVANLGDSQFTSPYLVLRTENDDLVIYRPFVVCKKTEGSSSSLRFFKERNYSAPKSSSDYPNVLQDRKLRPRPLRILQDVSGLNAIFMPGESASFVFRMSSSAPHVFRVRGDFTRSMSEFQSVLPGGQRAFVYVDSEHAVQISHLPLETHFNYSWTIRRVPLKEQVDYVTYSSSSEKYVLGTSMREEFRLPDDDELHPEWGGEVISLPPEIEHGSLKLLSPDTWSVIDSYPFGPEERVMAVKNIDLEVSENTHERRGLIVVGTSIVKGEDVPARGCLYVFEAIKVVPDPENPALDRKLKLIGKEPVKGAVTALSGIGGQGFLIVAQGQKCIVRGLKEDGSLLPVAFMDTQCYVSVVKELRGTGMFMIGDAMKGLWFAGYSEEPYKITLFGKDSDYLDVVAADFLPDGKRLYMLVADGECNLHILQYDPEDPKSSNGDRLLNRSKFHTGHFASTATLLPRAAPESGSAKSDADMDMDMDLDRDSSYQVLVTSQTGSIALVTPVSEESYRRLSALQSQLTTTLEHACGLNPRVFRAVESDGTVGRGMLDGNLLRRWLDLGEQRKQEIAHRVGGEKWEIRFDLASLDGLGYL